MRKWTKCENTGSPPFSYHTKMASDGYQAQLSINTERAYRQNLSRNNCIVSPGCLSIDAAVRCAYANFKVAKFGDVNAEKNKHES